MRRVIAALVVFVVIGGLWIAYHDVRQLIAPPATRPAETPDGLTDPPNWKVELPTPPRSQPAAAAANARNRFGGVPAAFVATSTRYGTPDSSSPPLWIRRTGKLPVSTPIGQQQARSVAPSAVPVPQAEPEEIPPPPPAPVAPASAASLVAVQSRPQAPAKTAVDDEHRTLLNHAKFLIRAGLAPMAQDPLQQIIREVPGTPMAQEARVTLDTIRN